MPRFKKKAAPAKSFRAKKPALQNPGPEPIGDAAAKVVEGLTVEAALDGDVIPPNRGGRPKGKRNQATIEREEAARLIDRKIDGNPDAPLAKNVLEECMFICFRMMRKFNPEKNKSHEKEWNNWSRKAGYWAQQLVAYQSPTMKAVALTVDPASQGKDVLTAMLEELDTEGRERPLMVTGPATQH